MNLPRVEAVRRKLAALKLDALLITHLPNIRYLSGFTGSNGLCLLTQDTCHFLTDRRYETQVGTEVKGMIITVTNRSLFETLSTLRPVRRCTRIGIESAHLSVATLDNLKKNIPECTFVRTNFIVESLASRKEEEEIGCIRKAAEITDKTFGKILPSIREGVRENELAAEISYWQKQFGGEADAFEPIVASGKRGALPHARSTDKKIKNRELVVLDFGCRYRGYHSDLTRTVAVGRPTAEAKKMYRIVQDAQNRAVEAAAAGITAQLLDGVARSFIKRNGYARYFLHSLGHGLGLQVHELPRVSALSRETLKSGNVITIEPGIYKPSIGGVRIEDDVVIRKGHCEVLTTSPKSLIVL